MTCDKGTKEIILKIVDKIVKEYHQKKVILFGSYAYGTPHENSDVDILVIMPARNEINQAVRIQMAVHAPFSMDLIVRTPEHLRKRLEEGHPFFVEVMGQGKVLHEKANRPGRLLGRG